MQLYGGTVQPMLASDLPHKVDVSERRCRARRMEALGMSPKQFVRQLRLSKARQLRDGVITGSHDQLAVCSGHES